MAGPEQYRRYALPYERGLIAGIKATCAQPVSLHICGNATPLLGLMKGSGADVLEVDCQVDMAEACRIVGPETGLWGNLDPVGVLAQALSKM